MYVWWTIKHSSSSSSSACKLAFHHGAVQVASHSVQQVNEGRCSDLSWGLKHDELGDISKPSGKKQETDIDLMSSHATMKENNTQSYPECLPGLAVFSQGLVLRWTSKNPISFWQLHNHKRQQPPIMEMTHLWPPVASASMTGLITTGHLILKSYYSYADRILTFSTNAGQRQRYLRGCIGCIHWDS